MKSMLFVVLCTLSCSQYCLGVSDEENSITKDGNTVDLRVVVTETQGAFYSNHNVTFNCSYSAKDAQFLNLTLSKNISSTVFYSYDFKTVNTPKLVKIDPGFNHAIGKSPGVIFVENTTDYIQGNYICTVFFNDTKNGGIVNVSTNVAVLLNNETVIGKAILEELNNTVQTGLQLSNQLHELTKATNETLKQEILQVLDPVIAQEIPTAKQVEEAISTFPLVDKYFVELSNENLKLLVKYAKLAKIEVLKH